MFEQLKNHVRNQVPVTDTEFKSLTSFFELRELKKGEHFLLQGKISREIGYVNRGCLRNYHTDEQGQEHITCFGVEDSWVVSMESFFSQTPSHFGLQALEKSQLLVMDRKQFDKAMLLLPFFKPFVDITSRNAVHSLQKLAVEKNETAEVRYQKMFEIYPSLIQRLPNHYIALYLNIKPQSLSRLRKKIL